MELSWRDYLAMHAPYIAMGILAIIGGIYTFGFEQGKRAILTAALHSAKEVT